MRDKRTNPSLHHTTDGLVSLSQALSRTSNLGSFSFLSWYTNSQYIRTSLSYRYINLIRFYYPIFEFCFQLHVDDWFTIALDRNSPTSVYILNGEEEIFAHFSQITINKAIEITERDYWTMIDMQVTETVDKTTDSSCNDNEID